MESQPNTILTYIDSISCRKRRIYLFPLMYIKHFVYVVVRKGENKEDSFTWDAIDLEIFYISFAPTVWCSIKTTASFNAKKMVNNIYSELRHLLSDVFVLHRLKSLIKMSFKTENSLVNLSKDTNFIWQTFSKHSSFYLVNLQTIINLR